MLIVRLANVERLRITTESEDTVRSKGIWSPTSYVALVGPIVRIASTFAIIVKGPGSVLQARRGTKALLHRCDGWVRVCAGSGPDQCAVREWRVSSTAQVSILSQPCQAGTGSEVKVPLKDTLNPTNYVALFGAIAQILASTVAIIIVAREL